MSKLSKTIKRKQKSYLDKAKISSMPLDSTSVINTISTNKPLSDDLVNNDANNDLVNNDTNVIIDYQHLCELADNYLQVDIKTLKRKECLESLKTLVQVADYYQKENALLNSIPYRQRVIELLNRLFTGKAPKAQLTKLYTKQLRQLALASGKHANTLKTQDKINALYYADIAVQAIEKLYVQDETQATKLSKLYAQQLKLSALGHNQQASDYKQQDDSNDNLALQHWNLANQAIEKLLTRFPEKLASVAAMYNKQVRQILLTYSRLAIAAKKQRNKELAVHYRHLSSQLLNTLSSRFPEQPSWVTKLLAKQAKTN